MSDLYSELEGIWTRHLAGERPNTEKGVRTLERTGWRNQKAKGTHLCWPESASANHYPGSEELP